MGHAGAIMSAASHHQPICWIIAGPNGAGKTTFALDYLPEVAGCGHFINADLIAAGLSPLHPESQSLAAARLYLAEIERCVTARVDFGFETTLSGRAYVRLIDRLNRQGWRTELIYLALPDVALSRHRVAERVAHGGHDIPGEAIERRFARSLRNLFTAFVPVVYHAQCHMNDRPRANSLVFTSRNGVIEVAVRMWYHHLQQESQQ
jgi:predicted ABC-type ATPase